MPYLSDLLGVLSSNPSAKGNTEQQDPAGQDIASRDGQLGMFAGLFSQITGREGRSSSTTNDQESDVQIADARDGGSALLAIANSPVTSRNLSASELEFRLDGQRIASAISGSLGNGEGRPGALPEPIANAQFILGGQDTPGFNLPRLNSNPEADLSQKITSDQPLFENIRKLLAIEASGPGSGSLQEAGTIQTGPASQINSPTLSLLAGNATGDEKPSERSLLETGRDGLYLRDMGDEALLARRLIAKQIGAPGIPAIQPVASLMEPFTGAPAFAITPDTAQSTATAAPINYSLPTQSPGHVAQSAVAQVALALASVNAARDSMEVQLDPPELGRVFIDFNFDGDRIVNATVSAEQSDTVSLMKKNSEILLRELSEAGFEGIELSFQDFHDSRFAENNESSPARAFHAEEPDAMERPSQLPEQLVAYSDTNGIDLRL